MVAQLYYTPTSCGAASFIAAHKAGIIGTQLSANLVDIGSHKVLSGAKKGANYYDINPKGNVPALVLDDGTLLNEGAAVLQWIADRNPNSGLAPAWGTSARFLLQSKLNYIASEVHASVGPLFGPLSDEAKAAAIAKLSTKLDYLSTYELAGGKKFLVGSQFTVADSYLYVVLSWFEYLGLNLADHPVLKAYFDNIASLDFVKAAHAAMAASDAELKRQAQRSKSEAFAAKSQARLGGFGRFRRFLCA